MKNRVIHSFVVIAVLQTLALNSAHATIYPSLDWESGTPESVQIDSQKLKLWADYALVKTKERQTDALLVIRHGKIVYENYQSGYDQNMRHLSWSMAKSFSSIVFGIAESEGIISRDAKMFQFYPYTSADPAEQAKREQVTMFNLLSMSSGIDWNESYSTTAPLQSDDAQMLYMNAHKDQAAYVASRPMKEEPGSQFLYSTGNINVAMAGLKYSLPKEKYNTYPWEKLFNKIGMKNVTWEQDDSGTFLGGSYVYATARDYARFGYLLLNNGKWNDEQVVPTNWMNVIKTLSPGFDAHSTVAPAEFVAGEETYSAGFWLNTPAPKWNISAPNPNAPADTFMAIGHTGQTIMMIPSKDLVIVRLAHDGVDSGIDRAQYLNLLLQSLTDGEAVPTALANDASVANASNTAVVNAASSPVAPVSADTWISENAKAQTDEIEGDIVTDGSVPVPAAKQTSVIHLTKLIASVRAKDFCSCHFVVGQSVEFCKELVLNGFPLIRMSVDETNKTDSFGILPAESAYLASDNFGCSFR
jgi:CubicO group peptidase (beta-lactamase class C family)